MAYFGVKAYKDKQPISFSFNYSAPQGEKIILFLTYNIENNGKISDPEIQKTDNRITYKGTFKSDGGFYASALGKVNFIIILETKELEESIL